MRYLLLPLVLALGCDIDTGPDCRVGKRCGNTCIAKDKVCHADTPEPSGPMNPYFGRR